MIPTPEVPTDASIREALRVCYDPELRVNIVDLGLVHTVEVTPDADAPGFETRYEVAVTLTRRSADEEREALLLGQVHNRLAGLREISRSTVRIVEEPAWTADRMTAAARRQLGLDTPARPQLVTIKL